MGFDLRTMDPMPLGIEAAFSVRGKRVLITGAAGWLGYKMADVFLTNGARVVMSDRVGEGLDVAHRQLKEKGEVHAIAADLMSMDDLKGLAAGAVERLGGLDVLVNNGALPYSPTIDRDKDEDFERFYNTNVRSVWLLTRYCLAALKESQGCIVNISSVNGVRPTFPGALYTSTKGAVMNMTQELAIELAASKVRVNSISPGPILNLHGRVGFWRKYVKAAYLDPLVENLRESVWETWGERSQPLPVPGRPADVAMACLYLSSPAARFVTGADLLVDGGYVHAFPESQRDHKRHNPWKVLTNALLALPEDAWLMPKPEWLKPEEVD